MEIISRAGWGAAPPKIIPETVPWSARVGVIYHHSGKAASQTVRAIQRYHMAEPPDGRGWNDIGYNFLIDQSGRIYQGRGWTVLGAHVEHHNTPWLGVCIIGNDQLSDAAATAARWLHEDAERRAGRRLDAKGHRDLADNVTTCPGDIIAGWVHSGMRAMPAPSQSMGQTPVTVPVSAPTTRGQVPMVHLPTLRHGATGMPVRAAQALANIKLAGADIPVDGVYGTATETQIRRVQRAAGVAADGICGPATWTVLRGVIG